MHPGPHRTTGRLVLSRREGERVIIGEGESAIVLVVMEIRGQYIRLGVEAPKSVPIRRDDYQPREPPT